MIEANFICSMCIEFGDSQAAITIMNGNCLCFEHSKKYLRDIQFIKKQQLLNQSIVDKLLEQ